MGLLTLDPLGHQLYENPGCDVSKLLNGRQSTSSSRFASSGMGQFLSIASIFPEEGTYRAIIEYSAQDGPMRVLHGGDHVDLPEAANGSAEIEIATGGDHANEAIRFSDLEEATVAVTQIRIYEVPPA